MPQWLVVCRSGLAFLSFVTLIDRYPVTSVDARAPPRGLARLFAAMNLRHSLAETLVCHPLPCGRALACSRRFRFRCLVASGCRVRSGRDGPVREEELRKLSASCCQAQQEGAALSSLFCRLRFSLTGCHAPTSLRRTTVALEPLVLTLASGIFILRFRNC